MCFYVLFQLSPVQEWMHPDAETGKTELVDYAFDDPTVQDFSFTCRLDQVTCSYNLQY